MARYSDVKSDLQKELPFTIDKCVQKSDGLWKFGVTSYIKFLVILQKTLLFAKKAICIKNGNI